jgi:hypothetical protein
MFGAGEAPNGLSILAAAVIKVSRLLIRSLLSFDRGASAHKKSYTKTERLAAFEFMAFEKRRRASGIGLAMRLPSPLRALANRARIYMHQARLFAHRKWRLHGKSIAFRLVLGVAPKHIPSDKWVNTFCPAPVPNLVQIGDGKFN